MQTATSESEIKSRYLSICVHHYTLRAPCPKGQGILRAPCPKGQGTVGVRDFSENGCSRKRLCYVLSGTRHSFPHTNGSAWMRCVQPWVWPPRNHCALCFTRAARKPVAEGILYLYEIDQEMSCTRTQIRLCISPPRGHRGTNMCNVCDLVTSVVVLLQSLLACKAGSRTL